MVAHSGLDLNPRSHDCKPGALTIELSRYPSTPDRKGFSL